jgi:hypothetical protein
VELAAIFTSLSPANTEGEPVSPSHVWSMLVTHDMPRLFCFHGREAWVRMPWPGTPGMAVCRSEDDFCGYLSEDGIEMTIRLADGLSVDFFQIAGHPNVRTKVYNYRDSAVGVAMETSKSTRLPALNPPNVPSTSPQ